MELLKVAPSPHIKSRTSASILLQHMVVVLFVILVVSSILLGLKVVLITLISLASAFLFELLYNYLVYEKLQVDDWSCVVTALMYSCISGINTPLYVPIIAMFFAIVVVKMMFGGFADNMFNPAASGAVITIALFSSTFTNWLGSRGSTDFALSPIEAIASGNFAGFNVVDFLIGDVTASIGCVCAIAVLVGAVYLLAFRVIDYKMPLVAIGGYLVFALILNGFNFDCVLPYLFSGMFLFASFYMLSDYTTSPNTTLGQIIYALIFGVLSAVFIKINLCGEMGVLVALIIANCFTPLFDRIIRPRYFGEGK